MEVADWNFQWDHLPYEVKRHEEKMWLKISDNKAIPEMIKKLNELTSIQNITICEPEIEEIVKKMYNAR